MLFVVLLARPILVFLCFLSELGTVRNGHTDARATALLGCEIIKWLHVADVD